MKDYILGVITGVVAGLIVYDWLSTRLVLRRARRDAMDFESQVTDEEAEKWFNDKEYDEPERIQGAIIPKKGKKK